MPKYSVSSSSSSTNSETTACELCGKEDSSLREANIAGAVLNVCSECAPLDENDKNTTEDDNEDENARDRKKDVINAAAKQSEYLEGDTSHWEQEGTGYQDDPLPYMVADYGSDLESARKNAGMSYEELAEQVGVTAEDIELIEQGTIRVSDAGGSTVEKIEDTLGICITENV